MGMASTRWSTKDLRTAFLLGCSFCWPFSCYISPQLKRSGEQGRDEHPVQSATLSEDGKTAFLKVPMLTPTMQFHVDIKGEFADGVPLDCYLHGTIQVLEEVDNIEAQ